MNLRGSVKRLGERLTDTHIYRVLPRGVELAADVARFLPAFRAELILDIGANIGQSAREYLQCFPAAEIHCLEPVRSTFEQLRAAVGGQAHVHLHQLALGARSGAGRMVLQGSHDMHFLLDEAAAAADSALPTESVAVLTLDDFCRQRHLERISLAKIDTEGRDLDVLTGAREWLTAQRIDLVQVEAGMNPENRRHVPLEALKARLESHGYRLFGLYEQVEEWPQQAPHLRRANAVFVSRRTIELNTPASADAAHAQR